MDSGERRSRLPLWMTLVTLAGCGLVFAVPAWREIVITAARHVIELDVAGLGKYLQTFGDRAWILTSLLMILQSLAAPIPAVPITLANAMIYGPWLGCLISWGSAQVAAMICFWLARALGRPFVSTVCPSRQLDRFDTFFARWGLHTIVVARLIPIVSFDIISYAAGLTALRALPFFLATGLGQLPACIAYSYAGAELSESPSTAALIVLWFLGGVALLATAFLILRGRRAARADAGGS